MIEKQCLYGLCDANAKRQYSFKTLTHELYCNISPAMTLGLGSSAIRRHKWGRGVGSGQNRQSPTRVLETLDLAKVMEKGLKQR